LAEATPRTSLRFDSPLNRNLDLGFGTIKLPRKWGICEKVLDPAVLIDGSDRIVIINDLSTSEQHAKKTYVRNGPSRFYAGVPLVSVHGNVVGAVCILDDKVRDGLSQEDIQYLKDLSIIIMEYLETYIIRDRYRRGAEGLHGLMSFAEGAANPQSVTRHFKSTGSLPEDKGSAISNREDHPTDDPNLDGAAQSRDTHSSAKLQAPAQATSDRRGSASDLQQSLLPATTKELFARAAEIMLRCNDMSGVMFIDAAIAATGPSESEPNNSGKRCHILGFATADLSSSTGGMLPVHMIPHESSLKWVLEHYPHGYSLDCNDAEATVWSDAGQSKEDLSHPLENSQQSPELPTTAKDRAQHTARVRNLIPNIKSALFLPMWDFERKRWFAGCFCWSTRRERVMDDPLDLPFLKAFGHSIMQEVARLDAMSTDQAKATFLSSLSHELRTPLHGILGSAHLIRQSSLDSFQTTMSKFPSTLTVTYVLT
jgi:hypothetical protein